MSEETSIARVTPEAQMGVSLPETGVILPDEETIALISKSYSALFKAVGNILDDSDFLWIFSIKIKKVKNGKLVDEWKQKFTQSKDELKRWIEMAKEKEMAYRVACQPLKKATTKMATFFGVQEEELSVVDNLDEVVQNGGGTLRVVAKVRIRDRFNRVSTDFGMTITPIQGISLQTSDKIHAAFGRAITRARKRAIISLVPYSENMTELFLEDEIPHFNEADETKEPIEAQLIKDLESETTGGEKESKPSEKKKRGRPKKKKIEKEAKTEDEPREHSEGEDLCEEPELDVEKESKEEPTKPEPKQAKAEKLAAEIASKIENIEQRKDVLAEWRRRAKHADREKFIAAIKEFKEKIGLSASSPVKIDDLSKEQVVLLLVYLIEIAQQEERNG